MSFEADAMNQDNLSRFNLAVAVNTNARLTKLFLNGLGPDQLVWQKIASVFRDCYHPVHFDQVGAAPSISAVFLAQQTRQLNVNAYASDFVEFVDTSKLRTDTVVIRHSLGAMAGLLASIQNPWRSRDLAIDA